MYQCKVFAQTEVHLSVSVSCAAQT